MTQHVQPPTPIAIIGMGCLFPRAEDIDRYWANILGKVDAITDVPPTHWNVADYFDSDQNKPDHTYAHRGGFLSPVPFPPMEFGITPKALEATDTTQLLGLLVAQQALENAGYDAQRSFDRSRVSVILGVTGTLPLVIPLGARLGHPLWRRALKEAGIDEDTAEKIIQSIADNYVSWQEDSFPGLLGNVVAGRIANRLNFGGTNCVVDAACASSLSALHLAILELQSGRSDMVLSGGMDTFNDIFMYMCFSKTPALSPTGNARPFDAHSDGTILGEGLACILLKRLADAERDGDQIYAVLRGIGTSSDGKGQAIYAPSPKGQMMALQQAYQLAAVSPDTIEMVEAHGTGTRAGDSAEVAALVEVYRQAKPHGTWCALGSVKSQIGHTKAAAGAAGLVKAALALHHKVLPPTIKVDEPLEQLRPGNSPFYINTEPRPWLPGSKHPRRAAVSSFGFGGSNYHCVLEEYVPEKTSPSFDGTVQIAAFAADSVHDLKGQVDAWFIARSWQETRHAAAQSRSGFRPEALHRLVLVIQPDQQVDELREQIRKQLSDESGPSFWSLPSGVFYGSGKPTGTVGVLFPGQGSQYVGMLRDLACTFPDMLDVLHAANQRIPPGSHDERLSDLIYPLPVFDESAKKLQNLALQATQNAQPAIGAVSLGAWRVLRAFGVLPTMVAGHSFGELTALCAAGALDEGDFLRIAAERGRLMAEASRGEGGMLAVQHSASDVMAIVKRERLDLVIANYNAPQQMVLSGRSTEIQNAARIFDRLGVRNQPLAVGAAFHSSLVAPIQSKFRSFLDQIPFSIPSIPVVANTTAMHYPHSANEMRQLLARQLAEPVQFIDVIERMYVSGVRTFVEVGPNNKLCGLVRSNLGDRQHVAMAVDASAGRHSGIVDLAKILALLAAQGHDVHLQKWDHRNVKTCDTGSDNKPKFTVPLCGANYVAPKEHESQPPVKAKNTSTDESATDAARDARPAISKNGAPNLRLEPRLPMAQSNENTKLHRIDTMQNQQHSQRSNHSALPSTAHTVQQTLEAVRQLSEQTARLHEQFLSGQERALEILASLVHGDIAKPIRGSMGLRQADSPTSNGVHALANKDVEESSEARSIPSSIEHAQLPPRFERDLPPAPSPIKAPTGQDSMADQRNGDESNIRNVLLDIVSQKTGYPPEMLEWHMELDADLGIDSIKRVEIFSALQERLPQVSMEAEHVGSLRSLDDVATHLLKSSPNGECHLPKPAPSHAPQHEMKTAANGEAASIQKIVLDVISEKTGYPPEMLELNMDLDADLGIDSIKRVEIFSALQERLTHLPPIESSDISNLRTLADVVTYLSSNGTEGRHSTRIQSSEMNGLPTTAPAGDTDKALSIDQDLIAVVSDKTGYPPEMLEWHMELDADLGIDSIKRVEIFSAIQERRPDLPLLPTEQLGGLRTLQDVLNFFRQNGSPPAVNHETSANATISAPRRHPLPPKPSLLRLVPQIVRIDESEARPSKSLPPSAIVWLISEPTQLANDICRQLTSTARIVHCLTVQQALQAPIPKGLAGIIILPPQPKTMDRFLIDTFQLLQHVRPAFLDEARSGDCLLVGVTRMDGCFGLSGNGDLADPVSGGIAGLIKTASKEWPNVHCKVIDLAPTLADADAAAAIVHEAFLAGPVEVGIRMDGHWKVELVPSDLPEPAGEPLLPNDVVILTGGARGITAEVAIMLAECCAPTLVLCGRSPLPEAEPAWLAGLQTERDIKSALAHHASQRVTPKQLGEQYRQVMAAREIRENLRRIEQAGSRVIYRQVDVRDPMAVQRMVDDVVAQFGPICGLVHGAGVLADRRIEDKTLEQFQSVYATKVDGLRHLLHAVRQQPMRWIAVFSSSTARFGRIGQIDYAAANEVMNKLAQVEAGRMDHCRVIALNWGPWDGGMVSPGLKAVFEREGLSLIPMREGASLLVHELAHVDRAHAEIVVLGKGSIISPTKADPPAHSSMKLAHARIISVDEFPVLKSHVLGGKAVVPAALLIEFLAEGAAHVHPGLSLLGFEDFRVFSGIKLRATDSCHLEIVTGKPTRNASEFYVPVEAHGRIGDGKAICHARALIVLGEQHRTPGQLIPEPRLDRAPWTVHEVYEDLLFHGPALRCIRSIEGISEQGIVGQANPAPPPPHWMHKSLRTSWLIDPLLLDGAFQLALLWSEAQFGMRSLPAATGRLRLYRDSMPTQPVRMVVRVRELGTNRFVSDIDFVDSTGAILMQIEGHESIMDRALAESFRQKHLMMDLQTTHR